MTSVVKVIKSVGPKLVPFLKTVAVYFVIFIPQDKPSVLSTILKCLPIVSLMLFVLLHGMSLRDEYKYSRRILTGLIFCCIGDALLIWNHYFDLGMLAFIIGHVQYVRAFGFKPLNLKTGIALYILGSTVSLYLLPNLHGVFSIGVPIYVLVITTMLWRAIARVQFFEDLWTWSKLGTCAGSILFALSDLILAIDRFKYNIEYVQVSSGHFQRRYIDYMFRERSENQRKVLLSFRLLTKYQDITKWDRHHLVLQMNPHKKMLCWDIQFWSGK